MTVKEEVAPVVIKKVEKEEVPMEQDTIVTVAKFDEAMMEEYDEDAVGDEFLEELTESKIATPLKNINKQLVVNRATNNQAIETNKQADEKKKVYAEQTNKQLWGREEDGGWYASSAKIVSRSVFLFVLHFLLLFVITVIAENNWFQKVSRLMNII